MFARTGGRFGVRMFKLIVSMLPLVFIGVALAVALGAAVSSPLSGLAGTGLILLGLPVYHLWRRGGRGRPAAS